MNWAKVGAVIIGAIIVFFIVNAAVHALLGLLGALLFVAVIGGGGYVAYKVVRSSRRREIRRGNRY
jgi:FtsH-binding integral membrane protein